MVFKRKIQESEPWTPPSLSLSFPSHLVQTRHKFHSTACKIFLHSDHFPWFYSQHHLCLFPANLCLSLYILFSTHSQVSLLGLTSDHGTPQLLFFKDFIYLFMRDTERERQRHRQREKQAPHKEPDVGLDPRTLGSRPGPKADSLNPWATRHTNNTDSLLLKILDQGFTVSLLYIQMWSFLVETEKFYQKQIWNP